MCTWCVNDNNVVAGDNACSPRNRFVLWTSWHPCPVAQFGRSSSKGKEGSWVIGDAEAVWGDCQRSICHVDGHHWERWPNLAFLPPYCCLCMVLPVRGFKGVGQEQEGGGERKRRSVHTDVGDIGSLGWPRFFDVWCLMPYFSMKKSMGGGVMLICY